MALFARGYELVLAGEGLSVLFTHALESPTIAIYWAGADPSQASARWEYPGSFDPEALYRAAATMAEAAVRFLLRAPR